MVKKVFYNSSLPRAGSTLVQNILAQNPEIYCSPTSGLFSYVDAMRTIYSTDHAIRAQDEQIMENSFRGALKGAIYGYYNSITDKPYVIDKTRAWNSELNFINFYDSEPKVICMIRDLRAVFASMEKKYRANPEKNLAIADWNGLTGTNLDKRIVYWSNNLPIGQTLDRLYDSILTKQHEKVLFIKFEDLCINPKKELKRIYSYLGLKDFQHDFDNVEQLTVEDDRVHGVFGDHVIRKKVELPKEDFNEILGEKGCKLVTDGYPWFYELFEYKI